MSQPVSKPPGTDGRRENDAVDRFVEWLDPPMAWLGVLFALLVGFELAVPVSPATASALTGVGWAIWGIFLLEYAVSLYAADNRLRFIRNHWVSALGLIVPTLRALRFLRLLRIGRALPVARVLTSSYRAAGSTRRLMSSRMRYLAAVTTIVIVGLAELAFLFELDNRTFDSFPDALLWSATAVIGMQGDPIPATIPGRLTMLAGFIWGLVVLGALAATIGTYLVDRHR